MNAQQLQEVQNEIDEICNASWSWSTGQRVGTLEKVQSLCDIIIRCQNQTVSTVVAAQIRNLIDGRIRAEEKMVADWSRGPWL